MRLIVGLHRNRYELCVKLKEGKMGRAVRCLVTRGYKD